MRHAVDPITVVSIVVLVEERPAAVFTIFEPVTGVFSAEFASLVAPERALAVTEVLLPHSFVLIAVLVELNAEPLLAIVFPVADVPAGSLPGFALD